MENHDHDYFLVSHPKGDYYLWSCPDCGQDNLREEKYCDNCAAIDSEWLELGL
jgi:uncharacterized OB-fold protein